MAMSLEEQARLLSMVDIFGPLTEQVTEDLAKQAPDTYLDEGEILYTPQESDERLFILKKGRVQVYEITDGGDEVTLSVVEGGNIFGEMSLTGQRLEGMYVRALVSSWVCSLRRAQVEDLIFKYPEVGLRLVRVLAERLYQSETNREDLISKDVPARLTTLVLMLMDSEGLVSGKSYRIPTRYTQEQLASMIGSKRVAVTRAFSRFKNEGIVDLKDCYIHILNLDALKRVAEAS